jgi:hypothetical protein
MPAASHYTFLRRYVEKYPDRVDQVNVIVGVYNLGALDPELCAILLENTQRVLKISGLKRDLEPKAKRRATTQEQEIYKMLKTDGQVTIKGLLAHYGWKRPRDVVTHIAKIKRTLLKPNESILSIDGSEFVNGVRDRTYQLMKR